MKRPTPRHDAFEEETQNDRLDEDTSEALDQRVLETYRRIVRPAPLPLRMFRRLLSYYRSHRFVDVLKRQWRRLVSR